MRKRKIPVIVLAFAFCFVMAGCGNSEPETGSVTSIRLRYNGASIPNNTLTVALSDSPLEFTAEVQTTGNATKDFTLSSSDAGIATVSGTTVTLLADGQTKITAVAAGDSTQKHTVTLNVGTEYSTTKKPYYITNNFGEDSSSELMVQWHNDSDVPTQTLQIVTETGGFANAKKITVTGKPFQTSGSTGTYTLRNVFRAHVTGLNPNTRYKYRIGNSLAWSDEFSHLTSSRSAADFSFTVAADPQSGTHTVMSTRFREANTYDNDNRFFLICGDIVDQIGSRPSEIVSYTEAANEFNIERPIVATQGNHDTYDTSGDYNFVFGEAAVFNAFVTFPDNGWDTHADKANRGQSYYFYYNKTLFIMLNTTATDNDAGKGSPNHTKQAAWLKEVLENDRINSLSRYKIVATHVGPFLNHYYEDYYGRDMRAAYGKIFSDYDVDIVFNGHDHTYARSNPIKIGADTAITAINFNTTAGGTIYSIAGSTGPKFYDELTPMPVGSRVDECFPKRTRTQAELSSGMFINVKVSGEKLNVTALRSTGSGLTTLDTYEAVKK